MKSMTGYGRGETFGSGFKFTVEINSVNRKQADIVMDIPRELLELETRIRDEINAVIARGRLNGVIACQRANRKGDKEIELDGSVAQAYLRAVRKLQRDLDLTGDIQLDTILRFPGVLNSPVAGINV